MVKTAVALLFAPHASRSAICSCAYSVLIVTSPETRDSRGYNKDADTLRQGILFGKFPDSNAKMRLLWRAG